MTKYKAQPVVIDGIRFASKLEGRYYTNLKLLQRAGEVTNVELQKPFALTVNGHLIGTYRCDFAFWDMKEKRERIIDCKGIETREFRRTKKLVKAIHGVDIEVVKEVR